MKKIIAVCIGAGFLVTVSLSAFSQPCCKTPEWVSEQGYWVAEKNLHTPKQCTIRFYNNANTMIAVKEIKGVKTKLNRKKTKLRLKSMLETALLQWTSTRHPGDPDLAKKP